jgi:hypothetical protein
MYAHTKLPPNNVASPPTGRPPRPLRRRQAHPPAPTRRPQLRPPTHAARRVLPPGGPRAAHLLAAHNRRQGPPGARDQPLPLQGPGARTLRRHAALLQPLDDESRRRQTRRRAVRARAALSTAAEWGPDRVQRCQRWVIE